MQDSMTTLRPLTPDDAHALAGLLAGERAEYLAHFHPFQLDTGTLAARFDAAREDRYWAIHAGAELAGFCMLRGWDEGYSRPSFGVFVAEAFAGRGLAREALAFCTEHCRARAVETLMLTVHPENLRARRAYEAAGFVRTGTNPKTGHDVLEKRLTFGILPTLPPA
jgi:RimJ/RimL family protein N-acetyltransferase